MISSGEESLSSKRERKSLENFRNESGDEDDENDDDREDDNVRQNQLVIVHAVAAAL